MINTIFTYNCLKDIHDQENSYFIVLKDDCAYYDQLAAKIKLSKSKVSNTKDKGNILVSKRDFTEKEKLAAGTDQTIDVLVRVTPPVNEEKAITPPVENADAARAAEAERLACSSVRMATSSIASRL